MPRWLPTVLIVVLTALSFLPALGADFLLWDDAPNFTENPNYRGLGWENLQWMFTTDLMGHYIPLTWLTLGLDYTLWEMDSTGYHAANILYQAAAALAFFALALILFRKIWPQAEDTPLRLAAMLAALVFSIHPLRVESVAWVTERRDMVSGLFFCLTIWAYVRMSEGDQPRKWYAISLAFYVAALLSKSMVLTVPGVLLVLDFYPLNRLSKRALVEKIPFALLSIAAFVVTLNAQKSLGALPAEYPWLDRVLQPCYRTWFYVYKTLVPAGLSPLYSMEYVSGVFQPKYLVSTLGIAGLTVLAWKRRPIFSAWLCYLLLLSPVAGFVHAGPQQVADRYSYLPCLPFALAVGAGFYLMWTRAERRRAALVLAGAALTVGLGVLTLMQTQYWQNSEKLWTRAIEIEPEAWMPYFFRGQHRLKQKDWKGAEIDFSEVIRRDSSNLQAFLNRSQARHKLGNEPGSISDFELALTLKPRQPTDFIERGFGAALVGKLDAAIADFTEAIRLAPGNPTAYFNRASARQQKGDLGGAIEDYGRTLELNPRNTTALNLRAQAHANQGNWTSALADLDRAIALAPSDPAGYANRGMVHRARGDAASAWRDFQSALQKAPETWPQRGFIEAQIRNLRGR